MVTIIISELAMREQGVNSYQHLGRKYEPQFSFEVLYLKNCERQHGGVFHLYIQLYGNHIVPVFIFILFLFLYFQYIFTFIQLQLSSFSPHPSTPPQSVPSASPTSALPLDFVIVSFIVAPIDPSPHYPFPTPLSGYCYYVLNFNVSGYILFAFFFC